MKRTTRLRFDQNARGDDNFYNSGENNGLQDQVIHGPTATATATAIASPIETEPPNSPAYPFSEPSLTPKFTTNLDNNVYEEPVKAISESAEWVFLLTTLGLEMLSAAFDQASSSSKPQFALLSMLCAFAALLTSIWELTYKAIKARVVFKCSSGILLPWFYYPPPHNTIFGTAIDLYGIVGGLSQSVCSTVQYAYFLHHADNPIKSSLLPVIFLMCLGGSRLHKNRRYIDNNLGSNNVLMSQLDSLDLELAGNQPLLKVTETEQEGSSFKLVFGKSLLRPIFTATRIVDEEKNPLQILLVDGNIITPHDQIASTTLTHPVKVEIVVLDGDFPNGENWTKEEFEKHIVRGGTGRRRPLLVGDVIVTVKDGFATIGDVRFTDNSSWIRNRMFRLGARVASGAGYQGSRRIREAVTEAFVVKDHRGVGKHYLPGHLSHTRNNSV